MNDHAHSMIAFSRFSMVAYNLTEDELIHLYRTAHVEVVLDS